MTRVWSYSAGDLVGVFDIGWQHSGDDNRFAFTLESGGVGIVDLAKVSEFVAIKRRLSS
jgi:hypothetical protein